MKAGLSRNYCSDDVVKLQVQGDVWRGQCHRQAGRQLGRQVVVMSDEVDEGDDVGRGKGVGLYQSDEVEKSGRTGCRRLCIRKIADEDVDQGVCLSLLQQCEQGWSTRPRGGGRVRPGKGGMFIERSTTEGGKDPAEYS